MKQSTHSNQTLSVVQRALLQSGPLSDKLVTAFGHVILATFLLFMLLVCGQ